ncbi:MAG: type II toxin-antitoxin system VapC family toxin [Nitrospiraceae bacterium]
MTKLLKEGHHVKAYLDNDMVSALARGDMPRVTMDALERLREMSDAGHLELVTSEVALREIERGKDPRLKDADRDLEKVEIIEDQELRGFNFFGGSGGWISSPRHEEHPTSSALRRQGLKRMDAHHLMVAVINRCDVFVTCDGGILHRRAEIERMFSIQLMRPEDLVAELTKVHPKQ